MASEAWVTRIFGKSTNSSAAWIAAIRGTGGAPPSLPSAWIGAIRGSSTGVAAAWVAAIRGTVGAGAGAPGASAGSAISVQPGSALRLVGSASATLPSTVASCKWRVVSKSATAGLAVFSDSTAINPRVRVPLVRKASWYVFGLTVKDSAGLSSPEATIRVDVRQAQLLGATTSGWQPVGIDVLSEPGTDRPPTG